MPRGIFGISAGFPVTDDLLTRQHNSDHPLDRFIRMRRKTPSFKARISGATARRLLRSLLWLNRLADDRQRSLASRSSKITRRPKAVAPQHPLNALADQAGRDAFEAIHPSRNRDLRRVRDEQMPLVPLAVGFVLCGFKVLAHIRKDSPPGLQDLFGEDPPSILWYKDHMNMSVNPVNTIRPTIPAAANVDGETRRSCGALSRPGHEAGFGPKALSARFLCFCGQFA